MNGVDDGWKPADKLGSSGSMIKSWDLIKQNFCERYGHAGTCDSLPQVCCRWPGINGYNGVWTVDHDDGSQFMNDTQNFMVCKTPRYRCHLGCQMVQSSKMTAISLRTGGGCKNFLGNSKHCERNVIVHPGAGMSKSGAPCQTDDNLGTYRS